MDALAFASGPTRRRSHARSGDSTMRRSFRCERRASPAPATSTRRSSSRGCGTRLERESVVSLRAWREKLRTPVVRNAVYLIATEAVSAALGLAFWSVAARLFPDDSVLRLAAVLITGAALLPIFST